MNHGGGSLGASRASWGPATDSSPVTDPTGLPPSRAARRPGYVRDVSRRPGLWVASRRGRGDDRHEGGKDADQPDARAAPVLVPPGEPRPAHEDSNDDV